MGMVENGKRNGLKKVFDNNPDLPVKIEGTLQLWFLRKICLKFFYSFV